MFQVHISGQAKRFSSLIKKSLPSHFNSVIWDNTDLVFSSPHLNHRDIIIVDEHWALRHMDLVGSNEAPHIIVVLSSPGKSKNPEELVQRARSYMEGGASECFTLDMDRNEIKGTLDFVFADGYVSSRFQTKKERRIYGFILVLLFLGLVLWGSYRHTGRGKFLPLEEGYSKMFHILSPFPSGITLDGDLIWISDWTLGKITSYRIVDDFTKIHEYSFKKFSPISIAATPAGLWSLGNDLWLRFHKWDKNLTVSDQFKVSEMALAGLAWDSNSLWSCDKISKTAVRIDLNGKGKIVEKFPILAHSPVGLVVKERQMWILDGSQGDLFYYEKRGDLWQHVRTKGIPFFSIEMNRPAGFGGDGKTFWITSERSGLIYQLAL